ncbi:hypothetical protein TrVE_jg5666 [Triparma verrucosa]|uniref:Uncharacterized protein n=1 Tax=Triparma verrucosa TaxID=1606542 RepID=A0A9W6ZBK4_9STRA|nr:hypothetical protein TrVE_jg5666 [Triparma verrucosa]
MHYLIPLPTSTTAADIDPWPGGLAQMSPPFTQIVKEILSSLIPGSTSTQIISEEDCSTLLIHETSSPSTDIACVIFPSNVRPISVLNRKPLKLQYSIPLNGVTLYKNSRVEVKKLN